MESQVARGQATLMSRSIEVFKFTGEIVNNMLKQNLQFVDQPESTTGALTSRVDSYPQAVFELMGFTVAMILVATLGVVSCSVVALAYG